MDTKVSHSAAELKRLGLLSCTGDDARAFLHAQLTNDVAGLGDGQARHAGWCSAKGRLLATFLVVPHAGGFLLQLSRDLVPSVTKRLSMFILRAKVKLADVSAGWTQFGLWGPGAAERLAATGSPVPAAQLAVATDARTIVVRTAAQGFLVIAQADRRTQLVGAFGETGEQAWALEQIRAGRPLVTQATQDLFVPQMINLERLGGVDFRKGCYPGQEIVARTQYRGALKRRMVRARVGSAAEPGNDLYADDPAGQACGTVVNAAPAPDGATELLAVVQISSLESASPIRLGAADGPALELLSLPALS